MRRVPFPVLLVGLVVGLPLCVGLRGEYAHRLIVAYLILPMTIGMSAIGMGMRALGTSHQPKGWVAALSNGFVSLATIGTVQVALLPIALLFHRYDLAAARSHCESLVARLEAARQVTGSYPDSVERIPGREERLPHLLRSDPGWFVSDGRSFVFSFSERDTMVPHSQMYLSDVRQWIRY